MIIKSSMHRLTWILAAITLMSVFFQNCSKGFQAVQHEESASTLATYACLENNSVDACLFKKNPVHQAGSNIDPSTAAYYQNTGVLLKDLDGSGYLSNASFSVQSKSGSRAKAFNGRWKYLFSTYPSEASQVSAYYYLTEAKNYFKNRTGIFYAENQNIRVISDAGLSGWSSQINTIHLENQENKIAMALDGSLVVNLLAHANAYYASNGQALTNQSATAQNCVNKKSSLASYQCCKTSNGCGNAILAGQADYLTAIYFEALGTALGESWALNTSGLAVCNVSRDVAQNTNLNASIAYSNCASIKSSGNIYAMGALYASVWWEARKKISNKVEFDKYFMKHLELIRGDDTFVTIQAKLQTLDQNSFSNQFYVNLRSEFLKRGL